MAEILDSIGFIFILSQEISQAHVITEDAIINLSVNQTLDSILRHWKHSDECSFLNYEQQPKVYIFYKYILFISIDQLTFSQMKYPNIHSE